MVQTRQDRTELKRRGEQERATMLYGYRTALTIPSLSSHLISYHLLGNIEADPGPLIPRHSAVSNLPRPAPAASGRDQRVLKRDDAAYYENK